MIFCNQKKLEKDAIIQVMLSELMPCIGQPCQTPAGRTELTLASSQKRLSCTQIQIRVTSVEMPSVRKSVLAHYSKDL